MRLLFCLLLLAACQPVNPSIRDGYTVYKGRTTVNVTVDPNIPKIEPWYPR